ncbi:MAG: hypothetical protein D3906_05045 [Candidatus Electrothrix sp. AUS1_2]|nr:hypothetical protein [Candidatus Electrothrix sp. AUS1_2]
MANQEKTRLELAEMIKGLREQLTEAQREGQEKGIRFTVEDVELELQITAEEQASGGVSAKFYVFTGKLDGGKKNTVTQKLKLKLKAGKADGKPLEVADDDVQRPD